VIAAAVAAAASGGNTGRGMFAAVACTPLDCQYASVGTYYSSSTRPPDAASNISIDTKPIELDIMFPFPWPDGSRKDELKQRSNLGQFDRLKMG